MATDGNQPIVIDNGSGVIKAGFAGVDKPKVVFRSCVGRIKHERIMPGGALEGSDVFIGSKVDEHRGVLKIGYPMENGIVQNWGDMERLWTYTYSKENLNVSSSEHPVLLTEPPLNPFSNREKAAELFFEGLNVPAFYCSIQAILSLFASGRTTGVVLDVGDGVSHVVPVYEGLILPHAIMRMDVAGRAVTTHLQRLLRRNGYTFHTSSELEVVREIKESCCVVAANPNKLDDYAQPKHSYKLPDGSLIELSSDILCRAPEILFRPDLIGLEYRGVHDAVVTSIMRTDLDLRRRLFSQIVLSGGSTLFHGFGDRLLQEVRKHHFAPKEAKIRIAAPPERLFTTWIGGSILASLSTFKTLWVSKSDYNEHGSRILSEKSL
jgi:centractin